MKLSIVEVVNIFDWIYLDEFLYAVFLAVGVLVQKRKVHKTCLFVKNSKYEFEHTQLPQETVPPRPKSAAGTATWQIFPAIINSKCQQFFWKTRTVHIRLSDERRRRSRSRPFRET